MTDSEIDDLLTPPDTPASDATRRRVLAMTAARLPRRGGLGVKLGLAVGGFAAGVAVTLLAVPTPEPRVVEVVREVAPSAESASPVPAELTAADWERKAAAASGRDAADWYRKAGDLYLDEDRDYVAAARCYRLFLEHADDAQRVLSYRDDSWLLLSLKRDRRN